MTESLNRKIARRYSKAVSNENFRSDGTLLATATIYDSTTDLPTSGVERGAQGYVSSNQRLYIRGTGGWYNIATINNTPTITSVADASSNTTPFTLATDGATNTVITITATDSEGFPITFSAVADAGFDSIATVSSDSSVFTITPLSEDSAGDATSGTLTFKVSDGVNIASEVATFTLTFKVENSSTTQMLIKASGNNGTNTSINDASSDSPASNTAHTITRYGNTSNQAFTPYHPGGYSVYSHSQDQDYIKLDASTDYNFDNNGWQLEGWLHPQVFDGGAGGIFEFYTDDNNYFRLFQFNNPGFGITGEISGSTYVNLGTSNGTQIPTDKWSHFAVTWDGSKLRAYLNGLLIEESGTISTDLTSTLGSQPLYLMQDYVSTDRYTQGYIYDVRLQTGSSAVTYTGNTYTVPTSPLTTDSNTKFHLAALPYKGDKKGGTVTFSDYSSGGGMKIQRFTPFDHKKYNHSEHGSSVYFDGTGDYLTVPTSADFNYGTGDYTIEFWHWPETIETQSIIDQRTQDSPGQNVPLIWLNANAHYYLYIGGASVMNTGNNSVQLGQWHHVVLQKSSNTTKFFINGVQKGSTYTDNLTYIAGGTLYIGKRWSAGPFALDGHIADFRIVKGTAVYNHSGFTPPTAPLTAIENTKLLTCNDAPDVFEAAGSSRDLLLAGTAKSSTAQKKNASASVLFDGNSDYIEISQYDRYVLGTRDFYVEFWMRYTGGSGTRNIIDTRGNNNGFAIRLDSSNNITVYSEPNAATIHTSASALTQDQWYHVAFVRNNKESYLFIDGAQSGSSAASISSGNPQDFTSNSMVIGAQNDKSQQFFPGYIEDLRIGVNTNRYPFIPTAQTLTAGSLTKALTCYAASATTAINSSGSVSITAIDGNGSNSIDAVAASDFGPAAGMKSVYFSGDYLYNLDLGAPIGTDDFCIEGWAYRHASSGNTTARAIFQISDDGPGETDDGLTSSGSYLSLGIRNSTHGNEWQGNGTINVTDSDTELSRWYHFAYQRNGGNINIFIDGSLISSTSNTTNYSTARYLTVGGYFSTGYLWYGYISNLRVSVGSGSNFFSNSFTPPTQELKG